MLRTPLVSTTHGRLDIPEVIAVYEDFSEVPLISISHAQRKPPPRLNWLATVHNGINLRHFALRKRPGKYLAFLDRPGVEYLGEIDEVQKNDFLGIAYAYLFPIDWPEPFGITMVEALSGSRWNA